MDLTVRRWLYLSFFAVFFITATALLFYLQGYRYNQGKGKIERTGALVVESVPDEAEVAVNGIRQEKSTPLALQSLQAGDYEVVVRRPDAQEWRKVLGVKPSRVTFTGVVRLWPRTTTGERLNGTAGTEPARSPNGEHILYRLRGGLEAGLWLLNLNTGKSALLERSSDRGEAQLAWAPSSRDILAHVSGSREVRVYNLEQAGWSTSTLPERLAPRLVRWGEEGNTLYVATADELYQWNLRTGALRLIWRQVVQDFRVHDGLVFALVRGPGGAVQLKVVNRNNLKEIPLEQPPQLAQHASFLDARGGWLPLLDQDRHNLYLLHSPLTELAPVRKLDNVLTIDWDGDGERLLLANNIELWEYRLADDRLDLKERVSETITRARFFGTEPYLIAASTTKVWALELDERSQRQRWLLAEYDSPVEDLFLDRKSRTLTVATAGGFYRLPLRLEPDGVLTKVRL